MDEKLMDEDKKILEDGRIYMEGWECGRKAMITLTLKRIQYIRELHGQMVNKWRKAKIANDRELKNTYYLKKTRLLHQLEGLEDLLEVLYGHIDYNEPVPKD